MYSMNYQGENLEEGREKERERGMVERRKGETQRMEVDNYNILYNVHIPSVGIFPFSIS